MNWHGWIWPPGLSSSTAAKRWWYDYPRCRSENQGLEGLRESEWSSSPLAGTPTRGELELTWKRLVECRTHWSTGHWVHLAGTWQSPDSPHTMTKKPKPQSQIVSLNRRHECGVSGTCWGWRYGEKKSKVCLILGCILRGNSLSILCPFQYFQYKVAQRETWPAGVGEAQCLQSQTALLSASCLPTNGCMYPLGQWTDGSLPFKSLKSRTEGT